MITVVDIRDCKPEYRVDAGVDFTLVLVSAHEHTVDAKVVVRLVGAGSRATIIGLVVASGVSDIKIHTLQRHEAPDTTSNLLIKTVLSGHARCVIDGGIRVEKKAQKTNAYQRNENLLLSEDAYAESKPSLEILANDVRCTHGATVGPPSAEELWYLASRGIGSVAAEKVIVHGFFASAISLVQDESVRQTIARTLHIGL